MQIAGEDDGLAWVLGTLFARRKDFVNNSVDNSRAYQQVSLQAFIAIKFMY